MLITPDKLEEARNAARDMHAAAVAYSEETYHRGSTWQCSASTSLSRTDWDCYGFPRAGSGLGYDATAPGGYGEDELARVSRRPILSVVECSAIIAEAERVAAWEESGRIAHYARRAGCLTPLSALPESLKMLTPVLSSVLLPSIQTALPRGCGSAALRVSDARLVKYNATASQTQLGLHRDGPLVTATIALNRQDEYDGGGTRIEALQGRMLLGQDDVGIGGGAAGGGGTAGGASVLRVPQGHAVLHPGAVRHGGEPITRGLRYFLVAPGMPMSAVPSTIDPRRVHPSSGTCSSSSSSIRTPWTTTASACSKPPASSPRRATDDCH